MTFDPDIYTITIRKETVDGETCYVGRVAEFQNVSAYEDTHEAALTTIRNVLTAIASLAKDKGQALPAPQTELDEIPSGRITLRMPRSLHAKVLKRAKHEDTSANQIINIAIAEYITGIDIAERAVEIIRDSTENNISYTKYVVQTDSQHISFTDNNTMWQGKPNVNIRPLAHSTSRSPGHRGVWKQS